jgi:hypothetical protein
MEKFTKKIPENSKRDRDKLGTNWRDKLEEKTHFVRPKKGTNWKMSECP